MKYLMVVTMLVWGLAFYFAHLTCPGYLEVGGVIQIGLFVYMTATLGFLHWYLIKHRH